MLNDYEKSIIQTLKSENDVLYNDITVMRTVISSILELNPVEIDGVGYFKVEDIVRICTTGFSSLSNVVSEEEAKRKK